MPTTTGFATDLITFSRGSLATVTDSNGYIKWAPHNLLLASEQFDTTSWTKTSATIAANSIAALDNAITADTIAASGANGTVLQSYTAVAVPYVFGVWLRRKTGTGNIQIAADNGTYTTVTITNDWALYTVTQTPTAGTKSAGIRIVTSGDEVYAWGAHIYRSDLGGMQANASAYPYYNPSTPKNLLGYSEAFDNAAWTKSNTSISANAIAAPNGSLSADSLIENTSAGFHAVSQPFTCVSGTTYAWSAYVKPNGRSIVQISAFATSGIFTAEFTLTGSGSSATIGGSGTASITLVGDGWYRISAIAVATAGGTGYWQSNLCNSAGNNNYTGDGTSGIYLWGAQLSDSASLDPYVPNFGAAPSAAAAHGPRLDYDPVTLAARGLLVEEARTNLLTYSSEFNNAVWSKSNIGITANAAVAPDGTMTADLLYPLTSGNYRHIRVASRAPWTGTYSASVYAKAAGLRYLVVIDTDGAGTGVGFDLQAGTRTISGIAATDGTTASITDMGGGWYRCTYTSTNGYLYWYVADAVDGVAVTASGTSGVYLWGAQLEAGAFATSYIPTAAATVTRNADVATVGVSQFPYSASEGSIIANVTPLNVAAARRAAQIDDGTESERYTLSTNSTPNGLFTVIDGGSSQAAIATGTPAANTNIKLAARYKVNDFALSVNGGAASTDTTGTLPTADLLMRLGSGTSSADPLNGHIRQITYIPRALTDAELATRSA